MQVQMSKVMAELVMQGVISKTKPEDKNEIIFYFNFKKESIYKIYSKNHVLIMQ
jgi:hypothetical protein